MCYWGWRLPTPLCKAYVLLGLAVANPTIRAVCVKGVGDCQPRFVRLMCYWGWRSPIQLQGPFVVVGLVVTNPTLGALCV
jgi:hypothetical protein